MSVTYFDAARRVGSLASRPLIRMGRPFFNDPGAYFLGRWEEIGALNVPGPFYTATTDTTGEGPGYAPETVLLAPDWETFIWRQPKNDTETHNLMVAASSDPFNGYACDGDSRWTSDLVNRWWADRSLRLPLVGLVVDAVSKTFPWTADEYFEYATTGAESDLSLYVEFLEGRPR